jgi:hypothetical protein
MQVDQRRHRDPWCADFHTGAGNRIQHPSRQHGYPAGCYLDVNDQTYGAIFAALQSDLMAMQRVPTIMNLYEMPDVGRMIGRWSLEENLGYFATPKQALQPARVNSLVETAKANCVEPHAYLTHLFTHLPAASTVDDFEALLPWNIKIDSPFKSRASP